MACSNRDSGDDGYATLAATLMALAMAMAASAVMMSALEAFRQAQTDGARLRAAYGLEAAQTEILATLLEQRKPGRYRWQVQSSIGPVDVLAEPEQTKLPVANAERLDDTTLARLGVVDAGRLKARLTALAASQGTAASLALLDPSPMWRACAASLISPYGAADIVPSLTAPGEPAAGRRDWHAGEIWRLRLVSYGGWAEDRIIRLTGDEADPAATMERRVFRDSPGGDPCRPLFQ